MTSETKLVNRYQYMVLQCGSLPLSPDGSYDAAVEHRCTSVLIWPEHEMPSLKNTVLTDPCFTSQGYQYAVDELKQLNLSFLDIGWVFITHRHRDHCSNLPHFIGRTMYKEFQNGSKTPLASMMTAAYPGHAPVQKGLLFRSSSHQHVCVCGDAVLSLEWLRAWKYYWPNFYQEAEILQTWDSVARILAYADLIIPGHGRPFHATVPLLEHLLATFPQAEYAGACQDVAQMLRTRLEQVRAEKKF